MHVFNKHMFVDADQSARMWHLDNLIGALARSGKPQSHSWVVGAPLLLQFGTVTVIKKHKTKA